MRLVVLAVFWAVVAVYAVFFLSWIIDLIGKNA